MCVGNSIRFLLGYGGGKTFRNLSNNMGKTTGREGGNPSRQGGKRGRGEGRKGEKRKEKKRRGLNISKHVFLAVYCKLSGGSIFISFG